MKRLFTLLTAATIICSCSEQAKKQQETESAKTDTISTKNNATDSVSAEPVFDSGLEISFSKFSAEKCFTEDPEEFQMTETGEFCAERKVQLLVAKTTDIKTGEAINKELFRRITNQKGGNSGMQAFVNKIKSTTDIYEANYEDWTCSILEQTNKILSVGILYEYMGYGSAHGGTELLCVNFNLENGQVLKLEDVLSSGFLKELKKIGEKQFIAKNGKDGWEFDPGKGNFPLAENYSFTKKGIVFHYGQYEIGSYAMGMPEMTISYDKISQLIPETSPLRAFMKSEETK